jgi:hypothetical protein
MPPPDAQQTLARVLFLREGDLATRIKAVVA